MLPLARKGLEMIKLAVIVVMCFVMSFLAMAFYTWNINPSEWSQDFRFSSIMIGFVASLVCVGIYKGEYI